MRSAPIIETDRLRLEPVSMAHWEAYAESWADPEMTAFIGGKPRSRTESWGKFLAAAGLWALLGYGYWSFVDKRTGAYLGGGGLAQFERGVAELEDFPEAGWAFIPSAWGKGYATEAMRAVLDWADNTLNAREVRCIIDADNLASRKVAEKLGFAYLCDSRDALGPIQIFARTAR